MSKIKDKSGTARKRHEKRDTARIMFVTSEMSAVDIATALDLNVKTVGEWRKADNWDEERTIRNVSPVALVKRLNGEIEKILNVTDGTKRLTPADADMIKKLTKSIKELRNSIDPQTVMEVLHGYTAWLSSIDLPLAQKIAEKNISYLQMKLKEHKEK